MLFHSLFLSHVIWESNAELFLRFLLRSVTNSTQRRQRHRGGDGGTAAVERHRSYRRHSPQTGRGSDKKTLWSLFPPDFWLPAGASHWPHKLEASRQGIPVAAVHKRLTSQSRHRAEKSEECLMRQTKGWLIMKILLKVWCLIFYELLFKNPFFTACDLNIFLVFHLCSKLFVDNNFYSFGET